MPTAKDPISRIKESEFRVLERQKESQNPSRQGPHYPKLAQVAHPHIGAFNSLFSFGSGPGLLEIATNSIPHVFVFDGERGSAVSQRNKIECKSLGLAAEQLMKLLGKKVFLWLLRNIF